MTGTGGITERIEERLFFGRIFKILDRLTYILAGVPNRAHLSSANNMIPKLNSLQAHAVREIRLPTRST